jgi:DtxR family manganese transport transcriptional regulator
MLMTMTEPSRAPAHTEDLSLSTEDQARNFGRVREAHRREIAEDYVEMIAELAASQPDVRTGHLAERFGVSHATVTNHVQRLIGEGLIEDRPYQPLILTDEGQRVAEASRRRHVLVRDFLIAVGVDAETAEADTEGIEHHVSEATLEAFAHFLSRDPDHGPEEQPATKQKGRGLSS